MGRPKAIETPEEMWEHFVEYRKRTKDNPIIVIDYVGGQGQQVNRRKERPLTMEGFECYLWESKICQDISQYVANREGRYEEFVPIVAAVRREIRQDQVSGGMAGIYNASLTARINGLVEKTSNENVNRDVPIFNFTKKD